MNWTRQPDIVGGSGAGYYASVVVNRNETLLFTNTAGTTASAGSLYRRKYAIDSLTAPEKVLSIAQLPDRYIRTSAIVSGASGRLYGLLYTGDSYSPYNTNGFSPSSAYSDDNGATWTWMGHIPLYDTPKRPFCSGMAMTVNEGATPQFRAWIDINGKLREMRSQDGLAWTDHSEVPTPAGDVPVFPSACRTSTGTMLAFGDKWGTYGCTNIRTLWQPHGSTTWTVLEMSSEIRNNEPKGAALMWDGTVIHAYNNGAHFTCANQT